MCDAPHARYRDRLRLLSADAPLTRAITELGSQRGWWPDLAWSRMSDRFEPHAAAFGDFLFEHHGPPQSICRVEAFDTRPAPAHVDAPCAHTDAGWLRVRRFPCDDALPALPSVLAEPGRATVVRYHPGRRCTIRFEQRDRTMFAKVYAINRGERVHRAGLALWEAAGRGKLELDVARPERWEPHTRTLWQHNLAGTPVSDRLRGADGPRLTHRIGRALASLTRAQLQAGNVNVAVDMVDVLDGRAQMRRSERHGTELSRQVPRLAGLTTELLERLAALHAAAASGEPRPIHGAPHPAQWLEDGPRLGLVDFDRLSLGDPEMDAGIFLGDLEADGSLKHSVTPLATSFLAGYQSVAGRLDPRLVLAWRMHQQLSRALRAARAVRPDGDGRAERKLRRAIKALSEGAS
jgi:Phosphotransferase enzyme family